MENGEWGMGNGVPPFSNLLFENYFQQLIDFGLWILVCIPIRNKRFQSDMGK